MSIDFPTGTRLSLLEAVRDPANGEVWADFFRLYGIPIVTWATSLGLQESDAWDLVQEVFLRAGVSRGEDEASRAAFRQYDPSKGRFSPWFARVAWNALRDWQRRTGRQPNPAGDSMVRSLAEDEAVSGITLELDNSLMVKAMDNVRVQLETGSPIDQRRWAAFSAGKVDGLAGAEIALQLGVSEAVVYVDIHRVVLLLREALARLEQDSLLDGGQ